MTLVTKFKKDVNTIKSAVSGEFYLDVKNPKLYKKLFRYYQNEGVIFSGEPLDDYEILMDCLEQDLQSSGVV